MSATPKKPAPVSEIHLLRQMSSACSGDVSLEAFDLALVMVKEHGLEKIEQLFALLSEIRESAI